MCFSIELLKQLLILAIIIGAVVAILRLVIPYVLTQAGVTMGAGMNIIISALKIVFWAAIAIVVVVVCFELIACLISWSGGLRLH